MSDESRAAGGSSSQTLSRGIQALEVLAEAEHPLTIAELANRLGLHRSIVYRIVRTLEEHGLVVRNSAGALELGARLAALARSVARDLQTAALPELTAVANELGMTAFVVVLDGDDIVTTLVSVEPRHLHAAVAQRPGTRHSLEAGAPGLAIQMAMPAAARPALVESPTHRAMPGGYATSHDEVIAGLASVAAPVVVAGRPPAAVAVVYVHHDTDTERIGARLRAAAAAIAAELA
ncbi:IclR family transcriptional regulator [Cnuibacter sp. UC19_7]|uniref:IclR family transcriptional regulator n=1 Tax=Cnuibacter sp. UC19_7 TaxID=3350166 RepID=UPI003670DE37